MVFIETGLKGAYVIEIERIQDNRGFFARGWCQKEFQANKLNSRLVQSNIAFSKKKGTLRGMHYQVAPHAEVKLVRCTKGAIYDVVIDLRPDSSTFKQWIFAELTEKNFKMIYVPEGFAHGYQSLVDDTEVFYHVSDFYSLEHERGVRYNDQTFQISWPLEISSISDKDKSWPDFSK
jgi:dTDP-4-dehydrorhamnose 3,5-epimerase